MSRHLVVVLLFACSGCAGLIFEVIWTRQLSLVFGSTVQSSAITAGAFLFCLGLGALLGGRFSRSGQGLKTYAALELTVALSGALVTGLLPACAPLSSWLSHLMPGQAGFLLFSRCLLAFLLLGLPCLAMGASLPVLCAWLLETSPQVYLKGLSKLYAVNTLGAVVGVVLADWWLIQHWGLLASGLWAAALDLVVGALALVLAKASREASSAGSGYSNRSESMPWRQAWRDLTLIMGLGLSGTLVQVLFTRCLIVFHGSDLRAFSTCLAIYLGGLALGGRLAGWLGRQIERSLNLVLLGASLALLLSLFTLGWASQLQPDWIAGVWVIAPCALCLGACFPLASQALHSRWPQTGEVAGWSLLFNTLGSLTGALASGFVLLPVLGLQSSLLLAAILLATLAALSARQMVTQILSGGVALGVVFLASSINSTYLRSVLYPNPEYRYIYWGEDSYGCLALVEQPDPYTGASEISLMVDGFNMMGNSLGVRRYATAIGALPVLLQAQPEEALVICFGLAHTLNAVLSCPEIKSVDCVELSPRVIEAVSRIEQGQRALGSPKLSLKIGDGRHHLLTTPKTYSLVVAEPPPPSHAGVVNLYTREYYQLCRRCLKPEGIAVQWLPIFQLSRRDTRCIIRAFMDVFPQAYLVDGAYYGQLLLVGGAQPLEVDYGKFVGRAQRIGAVLGAAGWDSPATLLASIVAGPDFLKEYARDTDPLSDDWPILQYDHDFDPDYGELLLREHPRPVAIHFANHEEKREFEATVAAQRALRRYLYWDAAARSDPQKFPWVSALATYQAGRQALSYQPGSAYLLTMMLATDFFEARLRSRVGAPGTTFELVLNLARIHYLRGHDRQALEYVRQALEMGAGRFAQAFEILLLQESGQKAEALVRFREKSAGLEEHDLAFLKVQLRIP